MVFVYHVLLTHSPYDGHLGSFQFRAITSKATVNTPVQVFLWTCISFPLGSIPRDRMTRLCQRYVSSFLRNYQNVVKSGCFILYSQ